MEIEIERCCMKDAVKSIVRAGLNKKITEKEAIILCVYYMFFMMSIYTVIIAYNMIGVHWILEGIISEDAIHMIELFINMLVVMHSVEEMKDVYNAIRCKCEFRKNYMEEEN